MKALLLAGFNFAGKVIPINLNWEDQYKLLKRFNWKILFKNM